MPLNTPWPKAPLAISAAITSSSRHPIPQAFFGQTLEGGQMTSASPETRRSPLVTGSLDLAIDQQQFASLTRGVLAQVRGISHQDAEDAVQEAWLVLAQKAEQLEPGPIGGYLLRTALFKAMQIREKRRGTTSLDALTEVARDGIAELADPHVASVDAHVQLAELEMDPIAGKVLDAAREGASARVSPRGMKHQCARYTDDQVARVRALRRQGTTFQQIEELTGVPAGYCSCIARREARITQTTDGWTLQMIIDALRRFYERHGRAPRFRDAYGDPTLPSPNTASRHFGSWRAAVRAAGLNPVYGDRRLEPWTQEEMVQAFCSWRLRQKRWPTVSDMSRDPELPSPATTRRRLGTQSARRLAEAVHTLLT